MRRRGNMAKPRMTPQMKGTADAITDAIEQGVKKVMDSIGVATKTDLDSLSKRVDKIESWASAAPAKKRPGRPPGKKSAKKAGKKAGKKRAAKKPAGTKRTSKKPAAKKAAKPAAPTA
jgi:phage-related protein